MACLDACVQLYNDVVFTLLIGSSTFELPAINLNKYFPNLQDKKLSKEELFTLEQKLDYNTKKLKLAFADFVVSLQRHIEETTTTEYIITALKIVDKKFEELLFGCVSIVEVFSKIAPYFSFFDYGIIKLLAKRFGSRSNQQKLKKYRKMFAEFAKQRICECPNDAFGDIEDSEKCLIMKIDKQIDAMTIDDLQKFELKVFEILKCNLRLLRVSDGCVELTFRTLDFDNYSMLNITADQKHLLRKNDVLCIMHGEKTMSICESSSAIKKLLGIIIL